MTQVHLITAAGKPIRTLPGVIKAVKPPRPPLTRAEREKRLVLFFAALLLTLGMTGFLVGYFG